VCYIIITNHVLIAANKIEQWLSAPDTSRNYNEAREKYQKGTSSWFLDGARFRELQEKGDFLWIKGTGKVSVKFSNFGR
jgi:hypothetical protein